VHTPYRAEDARHRKRKRQFDEPQDSDVTMDSLMAARTEFHTKTFLVIVDKLLVELNGRTSKYLILEDRFCVLHKWHDMEDSHLRQAAAKLQLAYPQDLEDFAFADEFVQLKYFLKADENTKLPGPAHLLKRLVCGGLYDVFPNVVVALRIYLMLPSSNASGERSFSCLKRVKMYLRSTTGQERLSALSLLSIESELVRTVDFDSLIQVFANAKARKRAF